MPSAAVACLPQIDFTGAEFSGDEVDFSGAEFSGSTVRFTDASFPRRHSRFRRYQVLRQHGRLQRPCRLAIPARIPPGQTRRPQA
jgi:hypothetical protein